MAERRGWRFWGLLAGSIALLLAAALYVWRDDVIKVLLDPKVPFGKDHPPAAADYATRAAWALIPDPGATPQGVDVFFVHPTSYPASFTSYNGQRHWNAPIGDHGAGLVLTRVMLPNYAAPFDAVGDLYAPRYRQASLYTKSTLWDDALEARQFAYGDVKTAFETYVARYNNGRPFIVAGAEQGGELAARLLAEEIAPNANLRQRLVAAYLIDTVVPADSYGPKAPVPACQKRQQAGCLVAWSAVRQGDFTGAERLLSRAMVWNAQDQLEPLGARRPLCVNPLLGAASDELRARAAQSRRGGGHWPRVGRAARLHGPPGQRAVPGRRAAGHPAALGAAAALRRLDRAHPRARLQPLLGRPGGRLRSALGRLAGRSPGPSTRFGAAPGRQSKSS